MRTRSSAVIGLLAIVSLAACGGIEREGAAPGPPTPDVVAIVGADRITAAEFDAVIGESRRSWAAEDEAYPEPGSQKYLDLRRQAVELLIGRSRLEQAAAALGVDAPASEIERELDAIRHGQSDELAAGRSDEQLRHEIREDLLWWEAYRGVVAGLAAKQQLRNEAWQLWTQGMGAKYVPTWFAPGFDPADLPRNIRRHPRPTNQRPHDECDLEDRSHDYGELVEMGCAADVGYDPGPGDTLCPDLFLQESGVGGGFTSEQMSSGYSEAQIFLADRRPPGCWHELGPHSVSIHPGVRSKPVTP